MKANPSIVAFDDWIEITIFSSLAGFGLIYRFYPDGRIVLRDLDPDDDFMTIEQPGNIYEALAFIAEIATDNAQFMADTGR